MLWFLLFAGMEVSGLGGAEWMGYSCMSADGMSTVWSGGVRRV